MSPLTTSEGMWLAGHHLSWVSGVRPRQANRPGAAQLFSVEPFIIIIIIMLLWNRCWELNVLER